MRCTFVTTLFVCLLAAGGPVACERPTDDSGPSAAPAATPSTQPASRPTAEIELKDATGVTHRPLEVKDAVGAVLIFIATDCPISNSYAPEINRICMEYGGDGPGKFRFYLVYADPDLTGEAAGKHAHDYGYTCPTLLDTQHRLVERLRARVTPEAVVLGPDRAVCYHGRIDDKWAGYGKARPEPTTRELRAALDAIRAGKPVPTPETDAVGCPIEPR